MDLGSGRAFTSRLAAAPAYNKIIIESRLPRTGIPHPWSIWSRYAEHSLLGRLLLQFRNYVLMDLGSCRAYYSRPAAAPAYKSDAIGSKLPKTGIPHPWKMK